MCAARLSACPLSAPQPRPLCQLLVPRGYPDLPSALQGLSALAAFVCRPTLGSLSPPSVWGLGPGAVKGLRLAAFFV